MVISNVICICGIIITLKMRLTMESKQNRVKMVFKDYYGNLSDNSKEEVRNRILSESGMSYPTFYHKLRQNTFKPLEQKMINHIIEEIKQKSNVN